MAKVNRFKIEIPDEVLNDLRKRLERTRWTEDIKGVGWDYGTSRDYMRELMDYWQHNFDWRKQEADLNKFNHFKTEIDGITVHFIHEKGKGPNSVPIILTHGWPDSFQRFMKVIPMLTDPVSYGGDARDSFDVIVPSIPGFGFSDRVALTNDKIADIWEKLMTEVMGYTTFVAAAGDIGTGITLSLARKYPQSVSAIHLTNVMYPNGTENWSTLSQAETDYVQVTQSWWYAEGAYNMLQSTKPQTLGYSLNDSPVGLAAWIIEKFYSWTNATDSLDQYFSKDELLTNIMIYWVTQTINSSIRKYQVNMQELFAQGGPKPIVRTEVPTALAIFPGEPDGGTTPREWAERVVNVVRFTRMEKGGHFAALEVPQLYVKDLQDFFIHQLNPKSNINLMV